MSGLAVAAISARLLAEAARADGFEVVALDLFGDADTRRACSQWLPIGATASMQIDATRLLPALSALAQRGDVLGWIAGSGFDGRPDLLASGAARLPLIGTPADAARRARDPRSFFGQLDTAGIAHPPVRMTAPDDATAWLVKDAQGCGGWHIRRAAEDSAAAPIEPGRHYFQREVAGEPMSATFIANGSEAVVLGFNELIVRRFGHRPFVYHGVLGPVVLPGEVAKRLDAAVRVIAAAFSLRGLASLDFILEGNAFQVLEVNPRPPASIALYDRRCFEPASHGVVAAHLRACLHGELPRLAAAQAPSNDTVHGNEIVFAARPIALVEPAVRRLAECAACHDLPASAARFAVGDPVCSVSASGADAQQVRALLAQRREAVHQLLEPPS